MSQQYVYVIKDLHKSINGRTIIKDVWLSFIPGAKIGIIGANGAGKSTLMKIMAGIDKEFDGEAWAAAGVKVGYLSQEPVLDREQNVFDNIMQGLKDKKELLDKYHEINAKFAEELSEQEMNDLLTKQSSLQDQIEALGAWDLEREVEIAMTALRCPAKDQTIDQISGGEMRRVALCKLLLEQPSMLLLDEPTNHLDAESVSWLENYIKSYGGTVVVITHDRYFLDNVTDWILEIEHGQCIPWHSNYSSWLEQKQEKLNNKEKEEGQRQKQLKQELEWIRQAPKARQAKSKARISAYQELLNKPREKVINAPQIIVPNGPRLGDLVIEANNVCKNLAHKQLFQDFSFIVPKGAIVGIVGPNGAGKTTLFRMIIGQEQPDSGSIRLGDTVKLGYVDQSRHLLNDDNSVWQEISSGLDEMLFGDTVVKSRAYCAAFNFKGSDQQKKVGNLSGGERNRVHIAKLLKEGANVLLLDEPSNDLDIDTLRALEEAILDFAGCILVISHDRWFLDRLATHIIAFDGAGNVEWFEGNYQDYHNYKSRTGVVVNEKYRHKKLLKS